MLSETYAAIAQITTKDPVLTTSHLVPHLTHRVLIDYAKISAPPNDLSAFKYILLNLDDPGWASRPEFSVQIFSQVQSMQEFRLQYQQDRLYLFVKSS